MNRKNNILLLAATMVTVLNFQSCSKYDDNPAFSLSSKKSRLVGEWEVVKVDGQTSSYDITFEFEDDNDFTQSISYTYSYYGQTYTYNYDYTGTWEWGDGKESIEVTIDGSKEDWEISKLTKDEMKLAYDSTEVEFEKM
jgi:hypothetical protein